MCTVVFLRRPEHEWPLILAANRDEMAERPWQPPGRHWPDRDIVAGLDALAGGTWLGINDQGVVAGVLNRPGTLGPAEGLRSRGELPLEALDHADAAAAAAALKTLDPRAWRPFNLFVADNRDALWLRSAGGRITSFEIPVGLSMLTAHDLNDRDSARIRFHLPRFAAAPTPDPSSGDWATWEGLLGSREAEPEAGPQGAMTIVTATGFGTVSSSLIALPSAASAAVRKPVWRFGQGHPEAIRFDDVRL